MAEVSSLEQWILELINRARLDPIAAMTSIGLTLNEGLPAGTISQAPKHALSMSDFLLLSADFHSDWALQTGLLQTTGYEGSNPGDRMAAAGFGGGEAFNWGEVLHGQPYGPNDVISETAFTDYFLMDRLLRDPGIRAIVLSEDFTEVGISSVAGLVGGSTTQRAGVVVQDYASSDDIYITGGVYTDLTYERSSVPGVQAIAPKGVTGVDVTTSSNFSESNSAGGYRILATGAQERVTIGGATVDITMPGGNVKLDLIANSHIRSSHSIDVVSGVTKAELLGMADEGLAAQDTAGAVALYGNKGANHLVGNSSANVLDGRVGADLMEGGGGDDVYHVDQLGDRIIERTNEGFDTVLANASFVLEAGGSVERLTFGTGAGHDDLTGNELSQEVRGNDNSNRLDGGGGGDRLVGGGGDDRFIVRNAGDTVEEFFGQGADYVYAHVSFGLAADQHVEFMRTADDAAIDEINLTGNELTQGVTGNAGRNVLRGEGGVDYLAGGGGKDTLFGGSDGDNFIFGAATDSAVGDQRDVIADWSDLDSMNVGFDANVLQEGWQQFSFVGLGSADRTVGLAQLKYYHFGANTYLVGNRDADNLADFQIEILGTHVLTRNQLHGTLGPAVYGTTGDEVLTAFATDDQIYGNLGRDTLRGGPGADTFIYKSTTESQVGDRRDVIMDWSTGDKIDLKAIDAHVSNYWNGDFLFVSDSHIGRDVEQGMVRTYQVGGNTYVIGNTDGDGQADFQIEIRGLHNLTHADFIGVTTESVIEGWVFDETLRGTSRSDRIIGGQSADKLYGGAGGDYFAYTGASDSGIGSRDIIFDWQSIDRIDLSAMDASPQAGIQTYAFLGLGTPDRNVAAASVKYYHYEGNTYVVANTYYGTDATFQLEIRGIHNLTAANFVGLTHNPVNGTNASETVNGSTGSDAIRGGLGTDMLYGRGSADLFVYGVASDSLVGAERDVIMDWSADDKFDLGGMDAYSTSAGMQPYTFVGLGSEDRNVGQGAVKYYQYAGNTFVVGNATPDGLADFQIEIRGLHTLTAGHFIL